MTNPFTNRTLNGTAWLVLKIAAFAVATWIFAIPQIPLVLKALGALVGINALFLGFGAALAFGALIAYAQLLRTLLDDGRRPGLWHTFGIITTSLGINRVLPAGAAAGGVMTFKLLERAGIRGSRAAFTMATQSIGSALILNILLWISLLVALPVYGFSANYLIAVAAGAVTLLLVATVAEALIRRRTWLKLVGSRIGRITPRLTPKGVLDTIDDTSDRLQQLVARPKTMRRAVAWATANWLLDSAALWVFLTAFGVLINPIPVLVAFALANVAAFLPITPGGLGVVDLALAATLVGFGAPAAPVALGVAAYRLFNYWLPIPASILAFLSIRNIKIAPSPALASA